MSPQDNAPSAPVDAATSAPVDAAHRRWLIGMGITVAFGLFGAVMAVLAYSNSGAPSTPARSRKPGAAAPAPSIAPATPTPDKPGKSDKDQGGKDQGGKDQGGKSDGDEPGSN